jgi:hypothetical protein
MLTERKSLKRTAHEIGMGPSQRVALPSTCEDISDARADHLHDLQDALSKLDSCTETVSLLIVYSRKSIVLLQCTTEAFPNFTYAGPSLAQDTRPVWALSLEMGRLP